MKKQSKFYLIQVGNNIVSPLGFKYDFYTTDVSELKIWCGFDSIERLYKSAICNGIHTYKILKVNTTSKLEEVQWWTTSKWVQKLDTLRK